jgi:4-amino-4-deoxy-L-arabinose transferase-like glycosyltransferase
MAVAPPMHAGPAPVVSLRERVLQSDVALVSLLLLLWLLPLAVIGIRGEFAENDGWAHAATTRQFLETGRVVRSAWTFAPIISNVYVGALFAEIFGFSFAALRASTVFMGGLGVVGVFVLGRVVGLRRSFAFLAALAFGFGPLHLALSYTFMTDVPFTAFGIWSLVAFAWGFEQNRKLGYALGIGAALLATLSRQPGAVLMVAFLVVLVVRRATRLRHWGIGAAGGALLVVLALLFDHFVLAAHNLSLAGALKRVLSDDHPLYTLTKHGTTALLCLGLVTLPFAGLIGGRRLVNIYLPAGAVIAVGVLMVILIRFRHAPFGENVLDRGGIGPLVVHCLSRRPMFPSGIWWSLAVLGALGGGIGLTAVARWVVEVAWPARFSRPALLMLPMFGLLYSLPVTMRWPFFDRYMLPMTPVWVIIVALALATKDAPSPRGLRIAYVVAAITALLSTAAASDYLGHMRLRTNLIGRVLSRGVDPSLIEGGFEYDGENRYSRPSPLFPRQGEPNNAWFNARCSKLIEGGEGWDDPDQYLLSYCPTVPGFRVAETASVRRFLPPFEDRLYLHERTVPVGR